MHHPKVDKGRLYVKSEEGRGLLQLKMTDKAEITTMAS
jgi:hypothetical protein